MKKLALGFLVYLSTYSFASSGKSLLVVHPEKAFDKEASAGAASRVLLQNESFDRKIVVLTIGTQIQELTFDLEGLKYDLIRSADGTVSGVGGTEFVLAGGYVDACLFGALLSLVQASYSDIRISLPMNAVYAMKLSFVSFSSDGDRIATLSHWRAEFGEKVFREFLVDYVLQLSQQIPFVHATSHGSGRSSSEFQIVALIDGETIFTQGEGAQKIYLNLQGR